jgi:hypothetical protein
LLSTPFSRKSEFGLILISFFNIQISLESGRYRIAALTNNFQITAGKAAGGDEALGSASTEVKRLFDEFIESSQVGLR